MKIYEHYLLSLLFTAVSVFSVVMWMDTRLWTFIFPVMYFAIPHSEKFAKHWKLPEASIFYNKINVIFIMLFCVDLPAFFTIPIAIIYAAMLFPKHIKAFVYAACSWK